MNVVMMPIEQVKPYENNPRFNAEAVHDVAVSLRKYGFKQPLVVDRNGVIVVGHTRFEAAKQLNLTEVPVVVSELSDKQNREYRIADNKTSEAAKWNFEKLNFELNGLDFEEFEFNLGSPISFNVDDEDDYDYGETPESFAEYDENIPTKNRCPKCGYEW